MPTRRYAYPSATVYPPVSTIALRLRVESAVPIGQKQKAPFLSVTGEQHRSYWSRVKRPVPSSFLFPFSISFAEKKTPKTEKKTRKKGVGGGGKEGEVNDHGDRDLCGVRLEWQRVYVWLGQWC